MGPKQNRTALRRTSVSTKAACVSVAILAASTGHCYALVDGKKAEPKDYAATVRFTGSESCTATVVGPRAVMSAAHCYEPGKKATVELSDKSLRDLTCQRHPSFKASGLCSKPGDITCAADIALCKSEVDLAVPGLKYEVVQTDRSKIKLAMEAVLLGYGCTNDDVTQYLDLHVGTSTIKRLSKDDDKSAFLDRFILTMGGAHSCKGDRGAGAFDKTDVKSRHVIGVISAGSKEMTQIVPISDKAIHDFLKTWGDSKNGAPICGVHANVKGCR